MGMGEQLRDRVSEGECEGEPDALHNSMDERPAYAWEVVAMAMVLVKTAV